MSEVKTESGKVEGTEKLSGLKQKSVRGGKVMMGSQGITVAVQLVSTVILARILTPEDYGIFAMVTAITAFAGLFRDLGLSSAAIQKKGLTTGQQSNLFWLNVLMGAFLTVLIAGCAPLVARFYGRPDLVNVTLVLSLNFIIISLGTQHGTMLVRRMQFGRSSAAMIAGALATLGVSVFCGLQGYAYWSLVWGTLAGASVTTLFLFVFSPFRPGLPSRGHGMRELVGFGANVTAFNFVNYFARNLDNILIGKFVGVDALGMYVRAYQLMMFPIVNLRGPIQSVAFPALSRLQNEPDDFRVFYRKIIAVLSFVTMPMSVYLFMESESIIALVLGGQWGGVSPIFSALAAVAFIQPSLSLIGLVLLSLNHSRRYLHFGFYNSIAVVTGFVIGLRWGAVGVAASYAVVAYLTAYPFLRWAFKGTPVRPNDLMESIFRPAASSLLSAVCLTLIFGDLFVYGLVLTLVIKLLMYIILYFIVYVLLPGGRSELLAHVSMSGLRR